MEEPDFADSPSLVLSVYLPVLLLLGLYASYDIVDGRWRFTPYHASWAVIYAALFLSGSGVVLWYSVVQARSGDWKEVGASILAVGFAVSQFVKTLRVFRIVRTHDAIMQGPARRLGALLHALLPEAGPYSQLLWREFLLLWLRGGAGVPTAARALPRAGSRARASGEERQEFRCFQLSSSLFDDDSESNESARVSWLTPRVSIREHDAEEASLRLALVLHLVLDVRRFQLLDRLLRERTYLLAFQARPMVTTTGLLRRILTHGSEEQSPPVDLMAAQSWLRNPGGDLTGTGRAFFWIAAMSSREDIEDALGKFPPSWRRAPRPPAADIMYEACALLVLTEADWERVDDPETESFGKYIWSFSDVAEDAALTDVHADSGEDRRAGVQPKLPMDEVVEPRVSRYFDSLRCRVRLANHIADSIYACIPSGQSEILLDNQFLKPRVDAARAALSASAPQTAVLHEVLRTLASDAVERVYREWYPTLSRIWFAVLEEDRRCSRVSAFVTSRLVHGSDLNDTTSSVEELRRGWEGAEAVWGFFTLASSLRRDRGPHARAEVARWIGNLGLSDRALKHEAARRGDDGVSPGDAENGWDALHVLRSKMAMDAKDVFLYGKRNWGFGDAGMWMLSNTEESCKSYSGALRAYLVSSLHLALVDFAILMDLAGVPFADTPPVSPTMPQVWQGSPLRDGAPGAPGATLPRASSSSSLARGDPATVPLPVAVPLRNPSKSELGLEIRGSSADDSDVGDSQEPSPTGRAGGSAGETGAPDPVDEFFPEELQPASAYLSSCVAMQRGRMDVFS